MLRNVQANLNGSWCQEDHVLIFPSQHVTLGLRGEDGTTYHMG
jgi:hypothetical protein